MSSPRWLAQADSLLFTGSPFQSPLFSANGLTTMPACHLPPRPTPTGYTVSISLTSRAGLAIAEMAWCSGMRSPLLTCTAPLAQPQVSQCFIGCLCILRRPSQVTTWPISYVFSIPTSIKGMAVPCLRQMARVLEVGGSYSRALGSLSVSL